MYRIVCVVFFFYYHIKAQDNHSIFIQYLYKCYTFQIQYTIKIPKIHKIIDIISIRYVFNGTPSPRKKKKTVKASYHYGKYGTHALR